MTPIDEATVSRVTSRDGTEIGYWTGGQGPPLLLVHGLLGCRRGRLQVRG